VGEQRILYNLHALKHYCGATVLASEAFRGRLPGSTDVEASDGGGGGEASGCGGCGLPGLQPAARQDAPVRSTKVGVAQGVAERVHRAVDVAQPVSCKTFSHNVQCFECVSTYWIAANGWKC